MLVRALRLLLPLSLALALLLPRAAEADRPPVVLIYPVRGNQASLLGATENEMTRTDRYRILLLAAIHPLMRQADDLARVQQRGEALIEEGRKALVTLDHAQATAKLSGALNVLEEGFVRYYDPALLAQVRVLLGVAALDMARPDRARREFIEAHQLDPDLKLGAHYSPQVRAAFAEAGSPLPPPPAPSVRDLRRIVRLAGAKMAVVLGVEPAGERALIKGALYLDHKGSYTDVESRLVNPTERASVEREARALGAQMRRMTAAQFPVPRQPPASLPMGAGPPPPPPPPRPWYLRWYTLTAAGAVTAAAIVIPLVLRGKYVEVNARW